MACERHGADWGLKVRGTFRGFSTSNFVLRFLASWVAAGCFAQRTCWTPRVSSQGVAFMRLNLVNEDEISRVIQTHRVPKQLSLFVPPEARE
eukprot:scaffold7676_cov258-Pinguiococcus_pyrenoidosus.AAC.9